MVLQAVQMKATLDNVAEFRIPEDHDWNVDLDQGGATVKSGVDINRGDTAEIDGSRGVANLVLPSLKANISIMDKSDKRIAEADTEGTYTAEDNEQWKTMCVFECRGVEISKWNLTGNYNVLSDGEPRKAWKNKDVNPDSEFYDVDEQEEPKPVSISDIETRVITYAPKK